MYLRTALTGFGLSALFLAACSGGGGGGGGTTTPTPTATPTASPSPAPCPTNDNTSSAVLICQSSATNVKGFSVLLQTSGSATITFTGEDGSTSSGTASASSTSQLFSDLNANTPVVNIQTYGPCTKSASFGTSTTVTYQGYTTGDISCPAPSSPAPVTTIYTDVQNVESSLGLSGQ